MIEIAPETGQALDIAEIRALLGTFWGIDRPVTLHELAGALRLRGDTALQTATAWEISHKPPSGPVRLALDLMLPPFGDDLREIARELCEVRAGPVQCAPYRRFFEVLSREGDPVELMTMLVEHVARVLLTPPGIEDVIGDLPSESAELQARRYRAVMRPRERARRPPPEVVRLGPRKKVPQPP